MKEESSILKEEFIFHFEGYERIYTTEYVSVSSLDLGATTPFKSTPKIVSIVPLSAILDAFVSAPYALKIAFFFVTVFKGSALKPLQHQSTNAFPSFSSRNGLEKNLSFREKWPGRGE